MLDCCVREIRWTDDSEDHIARHNVVPAEVEDVIYMRPRLIEPSEDDTEKVFGRSAAGRYLMVVLAEAEDGRSTVVTARDMNDSERRRFTTRAR